MVIVQPGISNHPPPPTPACLLGVFRCRGAHFSPAEAECGLHRHDRRAERQPPAPDAANWNQPHGGAGERSLEHIHTTCDVNWSETSCCPPPPPPPDGSSSEDPRLPPVWHLLLARLSSRAERRRAAAGSFTRFFLFPLLKIHQQSRGASGSSVIDGSNLWVTVILSYFCYQASVGGGGGSVKAVIVDSVSAVISPLLGGKQNEGDISLCWYLRPCLHLSL